MNIHSTPVTLAAAHLLASAAGPLRTKESPDPLDLLAKKFGEHVSEVLTKLGATNDQLKVIEAQVTEIEQKAARPGAAVSRHKSIGQEVAESAEMEDFLRRAQSGKGAASIQVKATLTSATTDAPGSVGAGIVPARDGEFVALPMRRLTVRDLLPVIQVSSNSVEVLKQRARTNNAAPVAEGALKPGSDIQMGLDTVPIRTIAHWMKASKQVLDDIPQLRGLIDSELMYGLKLVEEAQLLYGDGSGQNVLGLVPQATPYVAPITVPNMTMIDQIGLAILQSALADLPATGMVLHPSDWMKMSLIKDANGNYILGQPGKQVARELFGLPVVDTQAMTLDNFLVGAFQQAATLYDRWQARIEVGYVDDDFTRNLVTILCEERIGLAVKRSAALIHGSFSPAGE